MIILRDVFETLVSEAAVIYGSDIDYYGGHPKEINNLIAKNHKKVVTSNPKVFFFLGIDEDRQDSGYYAVIDPVLAIVTNTKGNYQTSERIDNSFTPILYPIYEALLDAMKFSSAMSPDGGGTWFPHIKHDHYFYGSDENAESKKVFNDKLDAITLSFRNIKITKEKC